VKPVIVADKVYVAVTHSRGRAFTLLEIMIVICLIGILLMLAVPNFVTSRARARQRTCITNLRKLNAAKEQLAMEKGLSDGALVVSTDLAPDYVKQYPFCPEGGVYTLNPIGTDISCSNNAGPYAHLLP
jgi:prepilin-type N-terminal cleavage/methylation domain-containing protein